LLVPNKVTTEVFLEYHLSRGVSNCVLFLSVGCVFSFSIGEKGRQAFEKMDRICCELRETVQQEAEIEITVF